MKYILTCSFGKDSIATALLALQHGEPLDELVYSEVMFSDTVSGELPEHKRFIYETAIPYFEKRGIPTKILRGQKTYLDCFYRIVSRGNAEGKLASFPLTGRCSIQRDCKLPPIRTYQKTLPHDTVYYLGIAADEPIRLARLKANQPCRRKRAGHTTGNLIAIIGTANQPKPVFRKRRYGRLDSN